MVRGQRPLLAARLALASEEETFLSEGEERREVIRQLQEEECYFLTTMPLWLGANGEEVITPMIAHETMCIRGTGTGANAPARARANAHARHPVCRIEFRALPPCRTAAASSVAFSPGGLAAPATDPRGLPGDGRSRHRRRHHLA